MFNHPKKKSFKPAKLPIRRSLGADKVIPEQRATSSANNVPLPPRDEKFAKAAYKAADKLDKALYSIKTLPWDDDREGVPSSKREEYTQSMRYLTRIIKHEWNHSIEKYMSRPGTSIWSDFAEISPPRSPPSDSETSVSSDSETSPPRSPPPFLPPRLSISSDSVEF